MSPTFTSSSVFRGITGPVTRGASIRALLERTLEDQGSARSQWRRTTTSSCSGPTYPSPRPVKAPLGHSLRAGGPIRWWPVREYQQHRVRDHVGRRLQSSIVQVRTHAGDEIHHAIALARGAFVVNVQCGGTPELYALGE